MITPIPPYWQPALAGGATASSPPAIAAASRLAMNAAIRRGSVILTAVIANPLRTTAPQSLHRGELENGFPLRLATSRWARRREFAHRDHIGAR
ncbi:hypothetical protein BZL30_3296 [Mycobacterium kansasii]|uniref:Uncharacterized protein n=1 Tax=Mycobacterium kansasii TaxID=1768 RepID=A0A1V3XAU4_MYCKA|nr:hypothetical protein BZL30_3296 [Mycobacterium kansasii]